MLTSSAFIKDEAGYSGAIEYEEYCQDGQITDQPVKRDNQDADQSSKHNLSKRFKGPGRYLKIL